MERVINGLRYDTEKAKVAATNRYWDGHNWDRHGRTRSLMKTPKGNFFVFNETRWQGEIDTITPVDIEQAKALYEELPVQEMDYQEAFGIEAEEA